MLKIFIICKLKNTLVTLSDKNRVLLKTSSKSFDLKSKYKNNPYALKMMSKEIIKKLPFKHKNIVIYVKGLGSGRYNLIKYILKKIKINYIFDISYNPFNGCRLKKLQRK